MKNEERGNQRKGVKVPEEKRQKRGKRERERRENK